jgi:tetratricopeptide (TPR) repeat protein
MVEGDGDRMTEEYFRLIEAILESRGQSARNVSRGIGKCHPYFSRLKHRGQLGRSWDIVEKGLGISPRTLFTVLSDEVEFHQILQAFGPQTEPELPQLLDAFRKLVPLIETSPVCRSGEVQRETWHMLEDLEWRRFTQRRRVESDCRRIVLEFIERSGSFNRDDAVVAVGALGIWSTTRRHASALGDATQSLLIAMKTAAALGSKKLLARQLQRASYLLGDVDRYQQAESMAESAASLYADLADVGGLGKALIETGIAAYGSRDLGRAEARVLLGAGLLGSTPIDHIYKASAYHVGAKCCSMQGKLAEACRHLEEAARYAGSYEKEWAAIRWCAGNILFQLGDYAQAESALREALQVYVAADRAPDLVMLLLDLAMVLAAESRFDEVSVLARFIEPLRDRSSEKQQIRSYLEEAHACLLRAHHRPALERFRETYEQAWRSDFATP